MNKRRLWSRVLCVAGIVVSVVGGRSFWIGLCRDSLSEFCLLSGSGLVALGAFLGKSRHRTLLYVAYVLTVCGMIAALLLVFYDESRAPWSAIFFFAYPLGLIMSCVGAVLVILESFRRMPTSDDGVGTA